MLINSNLQWSRKKHLLCVLTVHGMTVSYLVPHTVIEADGILRYNKIKYFQLRQQEKNAITLHW